MKSQTNLSRLNRKKAKYNLDDGGSSEEENFNFLTHKGKKLEELDDFKDQVNDSDAEYYEDKDLARGVMNEEMVEALNFGGGERAADENNKKSREERHAEIIEKSKAYKQHAQEIKMANQEYCKELDEEWNELAGLVTFKGGRVKQEPEAKPEADVFDDILTRLKTESGIKKIQPSKIVLSEKEKAQQRREKLEKMQKKQSGLADDESDGF